MLFLIAVVVRSANPEHECSSGESVITFIKLYDTNLPNVPILSTGYRARDVQCGRAHVHVWLLRRAVRCNLLYCLVCFCVWLATSVSAIGISPPSVKMDYVPGQVYQIPVKLINYNNFPVGIETRTDGEFPNAFTVRQPITIQPDDSTTTHNLAHGSVFV